MSLDHQRVVQSTSEMLGQSQQNNVRTLPPAFGEFNHSLFPSHGFTATNQNFHQMPHYPHRSMPGIAQYNSLMNLDPIFNTEVGNASNFNVPWLIPPHSHSSFVVGHNPNCPFQENYVGFSYHQTTRYLVEQHTVINSVGENIWIWDSEFTETASSSHGNYISRQPYPMNRNLDSRVHPYVPPMQAMRRHNSYLQPQVPPSSYGHQINDPHYTSISFSDRTDSWSRNHRPNIPVDQMRNQDTLLPEDNILNRLAYMTVDDVLLVQGVTNSNVSNSRIDDENTIMAYEDLVDLSELISPVDTGLSSKQILQHLKIRTHISPTNQLNSDEEPEICIICQAEYDDNEKIGTLQCGHCYHVECITRWLQQKNVCPVCKATGLAIRD